MLKIDPQKEEKKIVQFIKKTLKQQGFKKTVLALSGGVDSSTTLLLLTKALGAKNVLVTKLPYGKQDTTDAHQMIKLAQIPAKNVFEINIKPVAQKLTKTIHQFTNSPIHQLRLGNIMARVRMVLIYDLAKSYHALVCGTENKSEYLLGYFTLYGDQASDFEPIRHLYKTQVIQLAKYLGVPKKIIKKPPTAGLWPDQTDEKELGFSYQEADPILYLHFEKGLTKNGIAKFISRSPHKCRSRRRLKSAIPNLVRKVLKQLEKNAFKHQLPYHL